MKCLLKDLFLSHIAKDLNHLGIHPGDDLLVHASLSSFGYVAGGAKTVIEGLLRAVSPEGTLLMPALSYTTVNSDNPYFSVKETPCCVGTIPECFRKMQGTVRSLHPTHSVCANGRLAQSYIREHELDDTPVGRHSPFSLLAKNNGKILMLGCGLEPNTSMHGIEELFCPPYLLKKQKERFTLKNAQNQERQSDYLCHDFSGYLQRYERIEEILSGAELKCGHVANADCFLIDAAILWEKAGKVLNEQPLYFVEKIV